MSKTIRILVVDDFSTMRRIIRALLGDLGYTDVHEAGDGAAALDLLKAQPFDFMITDCNMPTMTGLELLKAVRAEPATKAMPVLMVTAEGKRDPDPGKRAARRQRLYRETVHGRDAERQDGIDPPTDRGLSRAAGTCAFIIN